MIDYLKCVWWNKITLAGYSFLITAVSIANTTIASIFDLATVLLALIGAGCLAGTELGIPTLETYQRARSLYRAGKKVDSISRTHYCHRVALEAAKNERRKRDVG